jgi:sortase A
MAWSQHQLQQQWSKQQERRAAQTQKTSESVPSGGLTRLSIPKINLAAIVVEGTGPKQLLLGPGHMEDTATPGENGNAVISGHRDTFFRHIYELQKGDEVFVQRSGKTYRYAVQSKLVVQPTDLSVINPSKDARLTLITCYPTYYIGPAPERLVVVSKLVGSSDTSEVGDAGNVQNPNRQSSSHTFAH